MVPSSSAGLRAGGTAPGAQPAIQPGPRGRGHDTIANYCKLAPRPASAGYPQYE